MDKNEAVKNLVEQYVKTAAEMAAIAHDIIFGKDESIVKRAAEVSEKLVKAGFISKDDFDDAVEALSDHRKALAVLDNVIKKAASGEHVTDKGIGRPYGTVTVEQGHRPRFIGERRYGELTEADKALMRHLFGETF